MSAFGLALNDDSHDSLPRPGFRGGWQGWRDSSSSSSGGGNRTSGRSRRSTLQSSRELRDNAINTAERVIRRLLKIWRKLTLLQKTLLILGLVIVFVTGLLFLIFNERIFGWLQPYAKKLKDTPGGWVILWAVIFVTAFPPMIGFSSCATTAGFVYGVLEGWLILASATIVGSLASFLVSRTLLRGYVERMVAKDKRFAALTLTLKEDGLKLLCMIRLCPLPFSLSNGAMATVPSVDPLPFTLATAMITPKLFIHVFIGSRLAAIASSQHEDMPTSTKLLNYASVLLGGLVGTAVGWYIYQKTMARARQLSDAADASAIASATTPAAVTAAVNKFSDNADDPEQLAPLHTLDVDVDDDVDLDINDAPDYFDESSETRYADSSDEQ